MNGECLFLPHVGASFHMTAPSLEPKEGSQREITTTTVRRIEMMATRIGSTFVFYTQNSRYRLDVFTCAE